MSSRFQLDAQWQHDLAALSRAIGGQREHIAAGLQLRDSGALDEARAELALAGEVQERITLLEHALRDLR